MTTKNNSSQHFILFIGAFFIPFILLMMSFLLNGISPFGPNSLALQDAKNQYISYYAFFVDTIKKSNSLLYTLKTVLGGPLSGFFAYYLASPFTFLYLLFPLKNILTAFDLIQAVKFSCCGLTMAFFFQERNNLTIRSLIITTAYSLCGYNNVLGWCSMWVDAVYMLPLVAAGLHRIVVNSKPSLYIVALAYSIITCYYTGFMLCVFSIMYYFVLCLNGENSISVKNFRVFFFSSIASGGISATILLPAWFAMRGNTSISPIDNIRRYSYPAMKRLLQLLIPSVSSNLSDHLIIPSFVCVTLLFILTCVLLVKVMISKKNNWKRKLLCLAFFVFLLELWYYAVEKNTYSYGLGIDLNTTRSIQKLFFGEAYGYEIANGSPNIYVGPLSVLLAFLWFLNHDISSTKKQASILFLFVFYLSFRFILPNMIWHLLSINRMYNYRYSFILSFFLLTLAEENLRNLNGLGVIHGIIATIILVISALYSVLLVKSYLPYVSIIIGILVLISSGIALTISIQKPGNRPLIVIFTGIQIMALFWTTVQNERFQKSEALSINSLQKMISQTQEKITQAYIQNPELYRIRNNGARLGINDPMFFGYNGLSHFSSTDQKESIDFMRQLGVKTLPGRWANANAGQCRAADALLGVNYTLYQFADYEKTETGIWKNPYAFPFAFQFMKSNNYSEKTSNNAVQFINSIYHELGCSEDLFEELGMDNKGVVRVLNDDPIYLQIGSTIPAHLTIRCNGIDLELPNNLYSNALIYLGTFHPGDLLTVSYSKADDLQDLILYYEKSSVLYDISNKFQSQDCNLTRLNDGHLLCHTTVNTPGQTLMFTIPYDKAWHIIVDGERVAASKAFNMFLSLNLTPGVHNIELNYIPLGLLPGITITTLTMLLLIQALRRNKSDD